MHSEKWTGSSRRAQVYNRVFVRWTTHAAPKTKLKGISLADVYMARCCDDLAWPTGEPDRELQDEESAETRAKIEGLLSRLLENVRRAE